MAFFRPEKRPEGCAQPHDLSCENGVWGRFSPTSKAPLDNQRHCLPVLSDIIQRTTQLVNRVPFDVTTVYHIQNQKEVPETNWIV